MTARDTVATLFKGRKQWRMENFYRHVRQNHGRSHGG